MADLHTIDPVKWLFGPWGKVQRTCLDCGESWTLDAGLAHLRAHRPSVLVRGARRNIGDYDRAVGEALDRANASVEQQAETIRETRTCPKCGSESFKDRRI